MAAVKSELFVVCFKNANDNSVKYAGLDSRDSFVKNENPMSIKKFFSHDDATKLVRSLRTKGLDEGVTIRVKSLAQSVRDYSWQMILQSREATKVDEETMAKVLKRYETTKKDETKVEEPTEAETTEEVAE